jgi:hypothetical protein
MQQANRQVMRKPHFMQSNLVFSENGFVHLKRLGVVL